MAFIVLSNVLPDRSVFWGDTRPVGDQGEKRPGRLLLIDSRSNERGMPDDRLHCEYALYTKFKPLQQAYNLLANETGAVQCALNAVNCSRSVGTPVSD